MMRIYAPVEYHVVAKILLQIGQLHAIAAWLNRMQSVKPVPIIAGIRSLEPAAAMHHDLQVEIMTKVYNTFYMGKHISSEQNIIQQGTGLASEIVPKEKDINLIGSCGEDLIARFEIDIP